MKNLNDQLNEALEALKFYANTDNWHRPVNEFSKAITDSAAMLDEGHIARRALERISNAQEGEVVD